jgi:hypothetical protein
MSSAGEGKGVGEGGRREEGGIDCHFVRVLFCLVEGGEKERERRGGMIRGAIAAGGWRQSVVGGLQGRQSRALSVAGVRCRYCQRHLHSSRLGWGFYMKRGHRVNNRGTGKREGEGRWVVLHEQRRVCLHSTEIKGERKQAGWVRWVGGQECGYMR